MTMNRDEDETFVAILIDEDELTIDIDESEIDEQLDDETVVATFTQRRQLQFRAQSRTKRQWLSITLAIIAVLVTLVVLALESPLYNVDKIVINNNSVVPLTKAEMIKIQSLSQRLDDEPLYRADPDPVAKDIRSLPTIMGATIKKNWPGTITVTVSRRVPAAYIETDKGVILVDSKGFAFEKATLAPQGLPGFQGIDEITFTHKISDGSYLKIVDAAPVEMKQQIAHIAKEKGSYTAVLSDGISIVLGTPTQLKEKMAIVWSIILTKKRSDLGYIDVSVPSLPVSGSAKLKV